jgi:hypothetical protein
MAYCSGGIFGCDRECDEISRCFLEDYGECLCNSLCVCKSAMGLASL